MNAGAGAEHPNSAPSSPLSWRNQTHRPSAPAPQPPPREEGVELPVRSLPSARGSLPAAGCPRLSPPCVGPRPPLAEPPARVRRGPASPQRQRRSLEVQNGRRGGARAASARVRDRLRGSWLWRRGEEEKREAEGKRE